MSAHSAGSFSGWLRQAASACRQANQKPYGMGLPAVFSSPAGKLLVLGATGYSV